MSDYIKNMTPPNAAAFLFYEERDKHICAGKATKITTKNDTQIAFYGSIHISGGGESDAGPDLDEKLGDLEAVIAEWFWVFNLQPIAGLHCRSDHVWSFLSCFMKGPRIYP